MRAATFLRGAGDARPRAWKAQVMAQIVGGIATSHTPTIAFAKDAAGQAT